MATPDGEREPEEREAPLAAIATVRRFAEAWRSPRVAVLLDEGDGRHATLLECSAGGPVLLTRADRRASVEPTALNGVASVGLAPAHPLPAAAIEVDPASGELRAPPGAAARMASAVLELARALGGRSVASAEFATSSSEPLIIVARPGERLVLCLGDQQFEMPPGWPGGGEHGAGP